MRIFSKWYSNSGFTFVELTVVLGMVAVLIAFATANLTSIQQKTYLNTTIDTFVSDLKQQQLKAMVGDTEGRATHDHYGIHVQATKYTLFHGATYTATGSGNVDINFDPTINLASTTLPSSSVIFTSVTGDVLNFVSGSNTITLRNITTNEQKTITINRYGVISAIN